MPVGFKNTTDGSTQIAVDAVVSDPSPHWFPSVTKQGISASFQTVGNDDCHVILRGGTRTGPNYTAEHITKVCARLAIMGLTESVMVDCSHGNSHKDHRRQAEVAAALCQQIASGSRHLFGAMVESHLVGGAQKFTPGKDKPQNLEYGKSITDACIGWNDSMEVLEVLAQSVRNRRTG